MSHKNVLEIIKKWVGLLGAVRQIRTALSGETNLRRAGRFPKLSVWQNALHSGTSKRALRSSGWRWFCPPLWLTIPAISATRPHACASLQTCVLWHAVTRLFACWGHSGPLNALHRQGVGLGWLWGCYNAPQLTRQFQAQSNRRSYWVAPIIERIGSGWVSNLMRVLIRLTAPFNGPIGQHMPIATRC